VAEVRVFTSLEENNDEDEAVDVDVDVRADVECAEALCCVMDGWAREEEEAKEVAGERVFAATGTEGGKATRSATG
jgi:hypothetical protein